MSNLIVDNRKVLELFSNLSSKKQSKAFKTALRKGAQILIKETRSQLRKTIKKLTTKHYTNKRNGKKSYYSLSSGIKYSFPRKSDTEAKVHIMGDFRLRFFENGTKERSYISKHGKKHNTGKITGINFFKTAQSLKEKEVFSSMNRLLAESIYKIANK